MAPVTLSNPMHEVATARASFVVNVNGVLNSSSGTIFDARNDAFTMNHRQKPMYAAGTTNRMMRAPRGYEEAIVANDKTEESRDPIVWTMT